MYQGMLLSCGAQIDGLSILTGSLGDANDCMLGRSVLHHVGNRHERGHGSQVHD
jgi:hypothetical protein